jgi:hypothetical protein
MACRRTGHPFKTHAKSAILDATRLRPAHQPWAPALPAGAGAY